MTGHTSGVVAVACAVLDGRPVAVTGSYDGTVRVWDLATGQPHGPAMTGHTGVVEAVACAILDGRPVAVTGSWDGMVRVWDLTTGQPHGPAMTGHTSGVEAVACAILDGRPVAVTGSWDGMVRVWDLATGTCIDRWLMWDVVTALASTPDQHLLVVAAGWDIAIFDTDNPKQP